MRVLRVAAQAASVAENGLRSYSRPDYLCVVEMEFKGVNII